MAIDKAIQKELDEIKKAHEQFREFGARILKAENLIEEVRRKLKLDRDQLKFGLGDKGIS